MSDWTRALLDNTAHHLAVLLDADTELHSAPITDARDVAGTAYTVHATANGVTVEDYFIEEYARLYEAEGRGFYYVFLSEELARRFALARKRGAAVTASAGDGDGDEVDTHGEDDEMETETEGTTI